MTEYIAPAFDQKSFQCPVCNTHAQFVWEQFQANFWIPFKGSVCTHCDSRLVWKIDEENQEYGELIFPRPQLGPRPAEDLPTECKQDYLEAQEICALSPRGAAALLRLCLQKLCVNLGQTGQNINEDIKQLVKDGLPPGVQKALDGVRVIGNEAVHPGELDLRDDQDTAIKLFNWTFAKSW